MSPIGRRALTLVLLSYIQFSNSSSQIVLHSPLEKLYVAFRLDSLGEPEWQVGSKEGLLLAWSPLGLEYLRATSMESHLSLTDSAITEHDDTYTLLAGKRKHARNHYRELRVSVREADPPHRSLGLVFRAYDDGVAFRYLLPVQEALDSFAIVREKTLFRFPSDVKAWAFMINTFHSSFEGQYLPTTLQAIPDTALVYPPLTLERPDGVVLSITEADLTDYAGMYLRSHHGTTLELVLPPHPDGSGACVHGRTPFASPWRVILIGEKPGDLIESTLIQNLSTPSLINDVSWVRPGKVLFPWWPDFYSDKPGVASALDFENQKYYIDFAAENNISYLEMEPPWYGDTDDCITHPEKYDITKPIPGLRLPELFDYARSKHVGIFLWAHWANVDRQGDSAFAIYRQWGAAGVKIDFMNRDDQEMVRWYQTTLRKAAANHLMVYFHGAYKPTGLQRTYPHLLTQEGVFGNEQNKVTTLVTPEHTVTLPFTRMLAGPMDFTPGGFRNATADQFRVDYRRPMVMGTRCHQLAMFVVYDSPLMMVCDDPSAYRDQPGFAFIREVPTSWDDTKVIDGRIGEFIIVARKNGEDWYLGAMTDWSARDMTIPLDFLGKEEFQAEIYQDGADADRRPTDLSIVRRAVSGAVELQEHLAKGGGLAVHFRKK